MVSAADDAHGRRAVVLASRFAREGVCAVLAPPQEKPPQVHASAMRPFCSSEMNESDLICEHRGLYLGFCWPVAPRSSATFTPALPERLWDATSSHDDP